jgi:hypothetical protein
MSFFHRPENFSFRDAQAFWYHGIFALLLYLALNGNVNAERLLIYVAPIVGATITYYFATEGYSYYTQRNNMYSGLVNSQSYNQPINQTAQQSSRPPDIAPEP